MQRCSQCHIGRAWDAQGRCEPCSIGNVNLGAPAADGVVPEAVPVPAPHGADAPADPPAPVQGGPCTQCCIGVAWDEEGRCRPCSAAGVRLAPAGLPAVPPAPADPEPAPPRRRWRQSR